MLRVASKEKVRLLHSIGRPGGWWISFPNVIHAKIRRWLISGQKRSVCIRAVILALVQVSCSRQHRSPSPRSGGTTLTLDAFLQQSLRRQQRQATRCRNDSENAVKQALCAAAPARELNCSVNGNRPRSITTFSVSVFCAPMDFRGCAASCSLDYSLYFKTVRSAVLCVFHH